MGKDRLRARQAQRLREIKSERLHACIQGSISAIRFEAAEDGGSVVTVLELKYHARGNVGNTFKLNREIKSPKKEVKCQTKVKLKGHFR